MKKFTSEINENTLAWFKMEKKLAPTIANKHGKSHQDGISKAQLGCMQILDDIERAVESDE